MSFYYTCQEFTEEKCTDCQVMRGFMYTADDVTKLWVRYF
jgi:hypothetical protein